MSYVTTQLDDESGIQYQGVQDKTDINQIGNMANMLMLVEDIPRGRLDGSMTITKANKTAMLGQEKGNLYLQAVDDALDQNVPSIQVLRVNAEIAANICSHVGHYIYRLYDLFEKNLLPPHELDAFIESITIKQTNGVLIPRSDYDIQTESFYVRLYFHEGVLPDLGFIFCSNRVVDVRSSPM
ncbi:hypothetical protein [Acinetobacter colistiniresistens]|uniref:hypothetical protein n=1 Tax=Acinetobacter colistiniresistens TaxID=280145 RepID=UPI0012503764|nr:hypothetical protein [Acinetobacter colistiniresistens]